MMRSVGPGVGPVTATALVAAVGDMARFRSGRHLGAYLGLVPKQCGSGGKEQSDAISKRGDGYLRMLPTHGARAAVRIKSAGPKSAAGEWISRPRQRRPVNVVVLARANTTARIAWAVLSKGEDYGRPAAVA
jgi:transposase